MTSNIPQFVVVVGNPFDGFEIIGPFDNREEAIACIDNNPECDHDAAWIAALVPHVKQEVHDDHQSCH